MISLIKFIINFIKHKNFKKIFVLKFFKLDILNKDIMLQHKYLFVNYSHAFTLEIIY